MLMVLLSLVLYCTLRVFVWLRESPGLSKTNDTLLFLSRCNRTERCHRVRVGLAKNSEAEYAYKKILYFNKA